MRTMLLALALGLAGPALAQEPPPPVSVFVRLGADVIEDRSFDLVSEVDGLPRFEIGLAWAPGPLERRLAIEVSYTGGAASAEVNDAGDASLTLHSFGASAVYTLPLVRLVNATGRAGAGLDLARVALDVGGGELAQRRPGAFVLALLGLELAVPLEGHRERQLALGFELGRVQRLGATSFHELRADVDEDRRPPPVRSTPLRLGDIDLSGWAYRFSGTFRF